jgi:hypothetical protein
MIKIAGGIILAWLIIGVGLPLLALGIHGVVRLLAAVRRSAVYHLRLLGLV